MLHIREYAEREGGRWREWILGGIYQSDLPESRILKSFDDGGACYGVIIKDQFVHALRFRDGREWDCINGWRKK